MTQSSSLAEWQLSTSYADRLPGQYADCDPASFPSPELLQFNRPLAEELGLSHADLDADDLARVFTGARLPPGARPIAQAYAGHQFGGFVPQLGDGRALLLGEVVDVHGRRRDVALKGSGRTPFSRGGDGRAAVGPVLREYLIGEAMHALGVPTTRALAAVRTGEVVRREQALPGAVLTRVAASHIRVGTFQFLAARGLEAELRALADYAIDRHDPAFAELDGGDRYLALLRSVADRQAALIARWMLLGFIHGVMNTDNTAISGETIDYGPCAWMEAYDPRAVFSSIDRGGRYAFRNQPMIANWNLARFAETLLPLIDEDPERAVASATEVVEGFQPRHEAAWLVGAREKLGIVDVADDGADDVRDRELAEDWLELLVRHEVDFTLAWRSLADAAEGKSQKVTALFPSEDAVRPWLDSWGRRLGEQPAEVTARTIRRVSPIYVPRNHLVEEALAAASDHGDLAPFERLLAVTTDPFEERDGLERFAEPAPREFTACYKTFCGT